MGYRFHRVRADNLTEAYEEMRRSLGPDAVVLRTTQVKEGGLFGMFGRKRIELTASVPDTTTPRRLTAVEKRYIAGAGGSAVRPGAGDGAPVSAAAPAAHVPQQPVGSGKSVGADIGSDQRFSSTVAHFQRMVEARRSSGERRPPAASPEPSERVQMTRSETRRPSEPPRRRLVAGQDASEVIPFRAPEHEPAVSTDTLRSEIRQMRETLDLLVAETPSVGLPPEMMPHYRMLTQRGMDRKTAAGLVTSVARGLPMERREDHQAVLDKLRDYIQASARASGGIALSAGQCHKVALVGTTGVGKTTTIAKLAAHYALRHRARVALVTCDTYRIAAPQQLKVYADIIGIPMHVVNSPKEAESTVGSLRDYDLVLIDTPGGSQFNVRHLQELRAVLRAARPDEVAIVLSPGAQLDDLRFVVENHRCLEPSLIIFSKLDETRYFGAMYTMLAETGWPVGYLTVGQDVPDDIRLARPEDIAGLILEGKIPRGRPS